ncbi:MAG TPA: hypothetical protein VGC56_19260 [Allosphingosinicella sp.]|jgi:hypothetical protein
MNNNTHFARRTLIGGAIAAAGAAAIAAPARAAGLAGLKASSGKSAASAKRQLAAGGIADWQAAVGTLFAAETPAGTAGLRLASVEALPSSGARPAGLARDHAFVATFETAVGRLPPGSGTYRLSAGGYPALHVHLDGQGDLPMAVFN